MRCRTSESQAKFDVVEFGGGDEGANGCPSAGAAVGAREQMVFASERDGPDGKLDRVVIELDTAVIEEAGERPNARGVADSLGEGAGRVECGQGPS